MAHGPSCSVACGIFPDQGSNPCPLHWQADSQPLHHQRSPTTLLKSRGWGKIGWELPLSFSTIGTATGTCGLVLGCRHIILHHKLQIPFFVYSGKQSLVWHEMTCCGLERHQSSENTLRFGCSEFWSWFCFILFDLEDLIKM